MGDFGPVWLNMLLLIIVWKNGVYRGVSVQLQRLVKNTKPRQFEVDLAAQTSPTLKKKQRNDAA